MKFIAHRGNINGPDVMRENRIDHIFEALNKGFQVEIDIWYEDEQWWLGHDEPRWKTGTTIFKNAWCHAKNAEAMKRLKSRYNCFWQKDDAYTLTSKGYVWCNIGALLLPNSICVMPEKGYQGDISKCYGICSDFVEHWKSKKL
jgi:hypothetical protein